jgi:FAD/FMN-containing dehydrogenase
MTPEEARFDGWYRNHVYHLLDSTPLHTGEWQSLDTSGSKAHATYELLNVRFPWTNVPDSIADLQQIVKPNLPWAENHFRERVSGHPLNPGVEYANWPWYKNNVDTHRADGTFSHTYMERYWPKDANDGDINGEQHKGIRYLYGDLADVADLLIKAPLTRQAYLPVWFPEDTGAVHGERVPCSLGYHFIIRDGLLHCNYYIRSCDIVRHFRDDVYLTARLMQWVCRRYNGRGDDSSHPGPNMIQPGELNMHITSLHAFVGDKWTLDKILEGSHDDNAGATTDA